MSGKVQIVAFEGGELKVLMPGDGGREAALALPLCRLIVKVVRVPADQTGDAAAYCAPVLREMSPFPDEDLTVSCEKLRETPDGAVFLAAALPEGAADDIGEALDGAKLGVTRVDAIALGQLRAIMPSVCRGESAAARRIVMLGGVDGASLFVMDGDAPSAVRALSPGCDLRREILLSLLDAEAFGGSSPVAEVVVCGEAGDESVMSEFGPVRRVASADATESLAERAADPAALNALPASWAEVLEESRFKARLRAFLIAAGALWALVIAVLFGVPIAYGFMTDRKKALSKEHAKAYREVKKTKDKVDLVRKYSDHTRGALEILKAVSDRLPAGVELKDWNFSRATGLRFSGESADAASIYTLKDRLVDTGAFEGGVVLNPITSRAGRQSFTIECRLNEDKKEKER